MIDNDIIDKVRGSLIGGACGDAFGYPVEFIFSFKEIEAKYGIGGIAEYDMSYPWLSGAREGGCALISDDTQMSLYTAEALIESHKSGRDLLQTISEAYLAWYGHQVGKSVKISYRSRLSEIEELNQRRAPGNTCLSALYAVSNGKTAYNQSKGCGGIMRVAPIGIFGAVHKWTLYKTAGIAGESAEITHLHPLSTYSSAALAIIVQECIETDNVDPVTFRNIVENSIRIVEEVYGENSPNMNEFKDVIYNALSLFDNQQEDWEIIETKLGGGWIAEETLAIAVFSVARHIDDFAGCMMCAVNHGGDSDSTGAVAGNIIGAIIGYDMIPKKFTETLQFRDLIISYSDALSACNK